MTNWRPALSKLEGAYSDATIRNYRSDFEDFAQWCRRKRLRALPAESDTVAKYVDDRSKALKASSLKRKLCAIRKIHLIHGHENPAAFDDVNLALRRAVRKKPGRPRQALGVTDDRRDRLLAVCNNDLTGLRDRVLISVGFDTLCRRSELVALRIEDFSINDEGSPVVLVRRAKNDQSGQGRVAHLSSSTLLLVDEWRTAIGAKKGPLLRPVYRNTAAPRSLHPSIVGNVLKKLATVAQLTPTEIATVSGHSLRVGAAQTLVRRGVGLLPIMSAGGWRSANIVSRYVENVNMNPWQC